MGEMVILPSAATSQSDGFETAPQGELIHVVEALIDRLQRPAAIPTHCNIESVRVIERARAMAYSAAQRLSELNERVAQLEHLAVTDDLTGLLNRRGFISELQRTLSRARRYGDEGALIYVDVDAFKAINDTHGHPAGDAVLRHIARVLSDNVRCTDVVGRLGGDEFAVLLVRATPAGSHKRAFELARLLDPAVVSFSGTQIKVRASFGFRLFGRGQSLDVSELLDGADRAMYDAKTQRAGTAAPHWRAVG